MRLFGCSDGWRRNVGRVFVVQADLTKLVVDDVVVPCDAELNVHLGFSDLFGDFLTQGTFVNRSYRRPTEYANVGDGLWRSTGREGHPLVWLVDSPVTVTMPRARANGPSAWRAASARRWLRWRSLSTARPRALLLAAASQCP